MAKVLPLLDDEISARPKRGLRVVHTADWHLGGEIYLHNLLQEQGRFLHWLSDQLKAVQADMLIVAGDVFDNRVPANGAQKLYYEFLGRVHSNGGCEVLILGGNHDSASFLHSPRTLLRSFQIQVQGNLDRKPAELCRAIAGPQGGTGLLIGAVPYFREAEVRRVMAGESYQDQRDDGLAGLAECYAQVWAELEKCQLSLPQPVPVILTGHLPVAGAALTGDEQSAGAYIGNLLPAGQEIFPAGASYVALGHLHGAQNLGGRGQIRYSGTPLPLSFSEKDQRKSVTLLEFGEEFLYRQELPVEEMYRLREITGDWPAITAALQQLKDIPLPHLLKVSFTGDAAVLTEVEELREILRGSEHELVHFNNQSRMQLRRDKTVRQSLQELTPEQVFQHCLQQWEVPAEKAQQLMALFNAAQRQLQEDEETAAGTAEEARK
ncbi:MAG: exonuclease subunit SbcD [Oligosphaeraceae bacterium]|nr:exonuclease subunit SbcD [Oligosphaeraceae bacterium]